MSINFSKDTSMEMMLKFLNFIKFKPNINIIASSNKNRDFFDQALVRFGRFGCCIEVVWNTELYFDIFHSIYNKLYKSKNDLSDDELKTIAAEQFKARIMFISQAKSKKS